MVHLQIGQVAGERRVLHVQKSGPVVVSLGDVGCPVTDLAVLAPTAKNNVINANVMLC